MSAQSISSFSPQDPGEIVGEYAIASHSDVPTTLSRARSAQREWFAAGATARAKALAGAAERLLARSDQATALIVREVGKPVTEARGEVARTCAILNYYSQSCFAAIGEQYPPSMTGLLYTERRPHGVACLITPWNFPLAIPAWKAAPALAAGNAVILKPSPESPACAAFLCEVLEAELPAGLFTVAHGHAETAEALIAGADVVSFTGSRAVGRSVAMRAAERTIPSQCEMGGQNAAIVLPGADPEGTARMIAGAAMGYAGQKCTATRRVVVVGDQVEFVDALATAIHDLPVAAPEEEASVVGPVITSSARDSVRAGTAGGVARGATVLASGPAPEGEGWYAAPTLLTGLSPADPLAQEETFGPLTLLLHAEDLTQALAITSGVPYGLVTSIHGQDLRSILPAVAGCDTGLVKVNAPTTGVDFYAPFGGEKDSSHGPREQGQAALDFYSSSRTVTITPG